MDLRRATLIALAALSTITAACSGGPTTVTQTTSIVTTTGSEAADATIPLATTTPPATTNPTEGATTATGTVEPSIVGSDEFRRHTESALALLATQALDSYRQVVEFIDVIEAVDAGSGMDVFTKTYRVGEVTAFAPGHSRDDQVVWYAGTIVHDSCHSRLYQSGKAYSGRDAELECLADQLAALRDLGTAPHFEDYVAGLIAGVDEPGNDYWNDPNRHW